MRVDQALALSQRLEKVSDTARFDVELLLCHVLNKPRSFLYSWPEAELTDQQVFTFKQMLVRRSSGEPVAHIIGKQGFWTLELEVSKDTLIPRPETELLIEWVLDKFASCSNLRLADLGTGTGAIALALASEQPSWQIDAVDLYPSAVALAQRNAQRLKLQQVNFHQGYWCEPLSGRYDLLISNPPYIDSEHPCLQEGDVRFEPSTALIAEQQGMGDVLSIIAQSVTYLKPQGWLLFEHGYDQGLPVRQALQQAGFCHTFTHQDLNGHDRISGGCYAKLDATE